MALIGATFVMQLWRLDLQVPMHVGGDSYLNMGIIKNVDRHGWFYTTDQLGFPFGQRLYDYRSFSGDSFNLVMSKSIGLFTDDPVVIANLFVIASYPLVAASGYIGARLMGLHRTTSLLTAVVFALLPFHQSRAALHLFYTNYAAIPVALALAIRQAGPRPLVRLVRGARWWGALHRDTVVAALIVLVVATSGSYFGAFACFFLLFAGLLAVARRQLTAAIGSALVVAAIAVLMAAQMLPTFMYQRAHGPNEITSRTVGEFDGIALKVSDLLLPMRGHRLPVLRDWRDDLPLPGGVTESTREALGLFGAGGFIVCTTVLAIQWTRLRRVHWARRLGDAPLMMVGAVVLAVPSGLNWLIGAFGFTQVRAWNRISVYIAFLCVAAGSVAIERLVRGHRSLAIALLPLIGLIAVADQTGRADVPLYAERARQWRLQEDFVTGIERQLEPGAAVFQLPVIDYPENPTVVNLADYAQMFGYLHSDTLKWSYGGVKGREANWRHALDPQRPGFVDDLLVTGFTGLTINLDGFPDHGTAVRQALGAAGLTPSLENGAVGGLVFYDLQAELATLNDRMTVAQQQRRRDELLGSEPAG